MHHRPSDFIHFTCTHDSLSLTRAACGERRSPAPSIYGRRGSVRQLACTEQLLPQYNFYHTPFASLSYTSQSIFGLVLLKLSGTGDKPQLRLEGETLRTIVLVGRTLSGAGWRWGLYVQRGTCTARSLHDGEIPSAVFKASEKWKSNTKPQRHQACAPSPPAALRTYLSRTGTLRSHC